MRKLAAGVGGAVILAALFVGLVAGMRTAGGRATLTNASDTITGLWGWARDTLLPLPATDAAGDAGLAFGIAAAGALVTVALSSGARTGRGVSITLVAWAVVGTLLYVPGVLGGVTA